MKEARSLSKYSPCDDSGSVTLCKDVLSFYCVEDRKSVLEFLLGREYNVIPESSQRHEIIIMFTFFPTSEPKETPKGHHRSISGQIVPAEWPLWPHSAAGSGNFEAPNNAISTSGWALAGRIAKTSSPRLTCCFFHVYMYRYLFIQTLWFILSHVLVVGRTPTHLTS